MMDHPRVPVGHREPAWLDTGSLDVISWAGGQTHVSACIRLGEGSPTCASCSSSLAFSSECPWPESGDSDPSWPGSWAQTLFWLWHGRTSCLVPASCSLLSLSSSQRLLCWFLFCWRAWYPGPGLRPTPCCGLCLRQQGGGVCSIHSLAVNSGILRSPTGLGFYMGDGTVEYTSTEER